MEKSILMFYRFKLEKKNILLKGRILKYKI